MSEKKSRGNSVSVDLSIWALLARSSFYKVLAAVAAMVALEMFSFYFLFQGEWIASLEAQVERSKAPILFLVALGAVFFILARMEGVLGGAGRFTMLRLKTNQSRFFAIKTIYNVLCLLVLFAAQVCLAIWMAWMYGRQMPGIVSVPQARTSQILFMAFYQNEFLHCLLPMAETGKWVRNLLLLLALGMEAAGGSGKRNQITQAALFVLTAVGFVAPIGMGRQDVLYDILYIVVIVVDVWGAGAFRRETGRA